ncbi:MAG TPA: RDD family protein [Streptosporangiaceae bacterium]|nr:RDD family protein [Streptosporangiaceae bacterium]
MTGHAGDAPSPDPPLVIRASLQGHYAGFASRFAAFAVDVGVSLGVFMLALAAISFAASVLTGKGITWHRGDIWVIAAYAVWGFAYFAYSWAANGRTAGMALCGVRVVRDDGTDASARRAVARTLAFPLSFLLLGLGFAGILLGDRRRALHDVIAGTAVIYSWDARAARLRFLSRG